MSVQRDQVDAQKYVHRRVVNALLTSDADTQTNPLRTLGRATIVSCILGVLVTLGFLAYGFVSKGGSTDWQAEGAVVVAEETGSRYVYLDGLLHPVANLTSALLIAGGSGEDATEPVHVSDNSIAAAPRGAPLGILGAPDAVVDADHLTHEGWSTCSVLTAAASGELVPAVQVGPGSPGLGRALKPNEAILVDVNGDAGGGAQLVWSNARWPVNDPTDVLTAFAAAPTVPISVGTAWANVVPPMGATVELPEIPARGEPSVTIGGETLKVGQVLVSELAGRKQYYLAYPDGLLPVSSSLAFLALGDPRNNSLYASGNPHARDVDAAEVNDAGLSSQVAPLADLPTAVPLIVNPAISSTAGLCATFTAVGDTITTSVVVVDPLALGGSTAVSAPPSGAGSVTSTGTVDFAVSDRVRMAPGSGALVRAAEPDGSGTGTVYVITDQGIKYPVADAAALAALGYEGVAPDLVPTELLAVIPTGPSLDPVAARTVVSLSDIG